MKRRHEHEALGKASRGAQLLKANFGRGGARFRSTQRFISPKDKPNTQQGTRR